MDKKKKLEQELIDAYYQWNFLYENGGTDPFWPDGVNLNLVRNHIIYYKFSMEKLDFYPEAYYWELPQKVEDSYMANIEKIYGDAKKTCNLLISSKDYLWLKNNMYRFSPELLQTFNITSIMMHPDILKDALKNFDWVVLRRYGKTQRYLDCFSECREKVEKKLNEEKYGQLSIFDIM